MWTISFVVFAVACLLFLVSLQNCNSISKREAVRAHPTEGLLSYGPIRIEMPDRPQYSKVLFLYLCRPWMTMNQWMCFVRPWCVCVLDLPIVVFHIRCGDHDYLFGVRFRHTDDSGAACSSRLDCGLRPHRPHYRGQGRQQEARTSGGEPTIISLVGGSLNKTLKTSVFSFLFLSWYDS